jgi:hypothetical protein
MTFAQAVSFFVVRAEAPSRSGGKYELSFH